jgi:Protein of unknown function (DUF664)
METRDVLADAYTRISEIVHRAAGGLDAEGLVYRPEPGSNSIAWLVWHLTRIQDDHVSDITGDGQLWVTGDWASQLGLSADAGNNGQGDGPDQVAAVDPDDSDALLSYHDAVAARTHGYLATVDAEELDRIIDTSYDPPISVGVRLVSVISDNIQHAGQARYLRGIVDRLR